MNLGEIAVVSQSLYVSVDWAFLKEEVRWLVGRDKFLNRMIRSVSAHNEIDNSYELADGDINASQANLENHPRSEDAVPGSTIHTYLVRSDFLQICRQFANCPISLTIPQTAVLE